MKRKYPPTSLRYCACCGDEQTFKYDRYIGHSRCIECGWHYIPTLDPLGIYEKEKEVFELTKKNKTLTSEEIRKITIIKKLKELKTFRYKK